MALTPFTTVTSLSFWRELSESSMSRFGMNGGKISPALQLVKEKQNGVTNP